MPFDALLTRIRSEFNEMPGLRLTREQAQRLWGVERALCQQLLDALVETDFLRASNGTYARVTDDPAPRRRLASRSSFRRSD